MAKILPPVHPLCGEDLSTEALQHIEILDGIVTATNGFLIGRFNMAEYSELDEVYIKKLSGKYIHRDVWALIHDADEILVSDEHPDKITYIKGGIEASISIKNADEIKYPNYQSLIEKVANSKFDRKTFVAFNPEWILLAKKLFGKGVLIIRFFENEGMFLVFPGTDAKAFIGIMPMEMMEKDAVFDFSLT